MLGRWRVEGCMTREDISTRTESAERRIEHATDAIRSMSQELAYEVSPRPSWIDRISTLTRETPIQSLAIAFLIGVILSRR
jgi:ElaB/YqjD/DUF883 family membrane-anchored ribosome-binding protein